MGCALCTLPHPLRRVGVVAGRRISAPVFFRFGLSRGGMCLLVETMFDLVEDFDLILWVGVEIARVIPLEMRFEFAPDPPIGIAKVVVDHGIGGFEVDRPLELLHRLVVAAKLVIGPAKTVDDIAIRRMQLDRFVQHGEGFVEISFLIDPAIAEIIQNKGLVRVDHQRMLEIGLGLRPLLVALVGDAAEIIERPIGLLGFLVDRLRVGLDRIGILLMGALQITERGERPRSDCR